MLAWAAGGSLLGSHVARCALERLSSPGLTALVGSQPRLITPSAAPVKPMDSSYHLHSGCSPMLCLTRPWAEKMCFQPHNVLSWVVYEEYCQLRPPEKRGIHHKVSLTLGDGAGLGEGARVRMFWTPEQQLWQREVVGLELSWLWFWFIW